MDFLLRWVKKPWLDFAKDQWLGFLLFWLCLALAFAGELVWPITQNAYWVHHVLFGVGFPGICYWGTRHIQLSLALTVVLSWGNELLADPFNNHGYWALELIQLDHVIADATGIAISLWLLQRIRVHCGLDPKS